MQSRALLHGIAAINFRESLAGVTRSALSLRLSGIVDEGICV
jgi:hypothetical protein